MFTLLATAGWAEQGGNAVLYSLLPAVGIYVVLPLLFVAILVAALIVHLRKNDAAGMKRTSRGFEVKVIGKERD